jgi:FkbM family methyltransferase
MREFLVSFYYRILNILTLGKGITITLNGYVVRLPVRYYKYYPAGYEKENFDFYRDVIKPDDTILDVGGHIGLNAVVFAQLAAKGQVYVFEPAPNTLEIIKDTIRINKMEDRIFVCPDAVSDHEGSTSFYMTDSPIADNSNSLINHQLGRKLKKIDVNLVTIDAFIAEKKLSKVDFIKIDAEGAELDVLKGSQDCMATFKPKIGLGIHPIPVKQKGDSLEEIYDLLSKYGYAIRLGEITLNRESFCSQQELFDVQAV